MRKRIIAAPADRAQAARPRAPGEPGWLVLEALARVEITSEAPGHPIEGALVGEGAGWRANEPGEQTLRLLFDAPTSLRRIHLEIVETAVERTQELAIGWIDARGAAHEVVRQRWNFSPRGSTRETEDYRVELADVTALHVTLQPDVSGGDAVASIAKLRLG